MYCFVQLKGIPVAVLGLATALTVTQATAGETRGQAAVMTSGNGVAVSGTWDADGFHGVYSGPTGAGRVVQPSNRNNPPFAKPRIGAGVAIGPGTMVAIGDSDDDASDAVSVGTSAGAFAGAGAGGAVAISGPGGVAVGVPGAPLIIVGSGTHLWSDARKPPRNPSYRYSISGRPEMPGQVVPRPGKLAPKDKPAGTILPPQPGVPTPPLPSRGGSRQSDVSGE